MHQGLEAQLGKFTTFFFPPVVRYLNVSEGDYFKILLLATQGFLEPYESEEQFLESLEM